jgi:glycosyltransferase involved in cell wall biosynthesis
MPSRVLICRSNPVAPDPRVEKIARALSKNGWSVEVLGWGYERNLPAEEKREGYLIRRIRLDRRNRRGLSNLPGLVGWQIALTFWLLRHRKTFDIIHACDFDTLLPALLMRWLAGKRVVYDIFDFYADMLTRTPRWMVKQIRQMELGAIGRADAVILADDARRVQIKGSNPRRLGVVYNSPEESERAVFYALENLPISQPGGLRIAYTGNLQRERGLFELLNVLERHPDWRLDLAGFGPDLDEITAKAKNNTNITWHGLVPYARALELNAAADVLLATYDPTVPNHRFSSPNKVFEAMLLARPILVARGTNADRLVEEAQCGLVISYGSEAQLEQALNRIANDVELRARLGRNGRRAYDETYNWKQMEQRLVFLYDDLAR